jgi:dolichol-phosphate mannosyltransferase
MSNTSEPPPPAYELNRDITLFIACYNEEGNIRNAIENTVAAARTVGCTFDIVVIDDASKDRSPEIIRGYMTEHPEVPLKLIVNSTNQGLGANYSEGCFHGHGEYYRLICGDDEESRETIEKMLSQLGKADIVLSYHSDTSGRTRMRRFISWFYTLIINILSGNRIKYYNGLPIHRRRHVQRWHSLAHGFGFQADLVTRLVDMGATYVEVPVVPKTRTAGRTKAFTFRNFASVLHTFIEIFIRRVGKVLYPHYARRFLHDTTTTESPSFHDVGGRG